MEIHEFATVLSGYAFREAIRPEADGHTFVFQAKDLVQGVPVTDVDDLQKVSQSIPVHTGHLKRYDVLLIARGMKPGAFRSTVFDSNNENVIASASVHIIRVASRNILPEFLSLYLNSNDGQNALFGIVTGSYIGMLPRKKLEKITVPIPPLKKQKALVRLYQNIREQQRIVHRQTEIKQGIIDATLKRSII